MTLAALTGVGSVVALAANQVIGPAVGRARPFVAFPQALVLLKHAADDSFPSDHCMIAGALAAGLLVLNRRVGAFAVLVAVLLAFSRVYVGVHYPSDTVAGLANGAVITAFMLAGTPLLTRQLYRLSRGPLRVLVVARDVEVPSQP